MSDDTQELHKRCLAIMKALGEAGIPKDKKAPREVGGFQFRGIDGTLASLNPLLVEHGLLVFPRLLDINSRELKTAKGGVSLIVQVTVEYTLRYGSASIVTSVPGEGIDSGGKTTAKAMSSAYKTWVFQTFCVPVKGISIDVEDSAPEHEGDAHSRPQSTAGAARNREQSAAGAASLRRHIQASAFGKLVDEWMALSDDQKRAVWPFLTDNEHKQIRGLFDG